METNRGPAFGREFLSPPLPWRRRFPVSFQDLAEECQRVHTTAGGSAAISVFETNKAIWTGFIWGPQASAGSWGAHSRPLPPSAALSAHARRGSAGLCARCDSLQRLDFCFDLFNSTSTVSTDVSL